MYLKMIFSLTYSLWKLYKLIIKTNKMVLENVTVFLAGWANRANPPNWPPPTTFGDKKIRQESNRLRKIMKHPHKWRHETHRIPWENWYIYHATNLPWKSTIHYWHHTSPPMDLTDVLNLWSLRRKNLGVLQNSCEFGISLGAINSERWQNDVGKTVSSINWSQNSFFSQSEKNKINKP